jgi:hypothetical protein
MGGVVRLNEDGSESHYSYEGSEEEAKERAAIMDEAAQEGGPPHRQAASYVIADDFGVGQNRKGHWPKGDACCVSSIAEKLRWIR